MKIEMVHEKKSNSSQKESELICTKAIYAQTDRGNPLKAFQSTNKNVPQIQNSMENKAQSHTKGRQLKSAHRSNKVENNRCQAINHLK